MRLRSSLLLLVAATTLPLVIFAAIVSTLLVLHDQENFVRAVKDRNRAFMSAVDAELKGHIESLRVLTALPSIDRDDLPQIHRDMVAAVATQRDWIAIVLVAPNGRQLVNTALPYASALPETGQIESFEASPATLQPTVGSISRGRFVDAYGIPVRLPVARDGKPVYVLTAVVKQEVFQALLERQEIPPGWVAGITASDFRLIARVPPRAAGSSPSPAFVQEVKSAPEGWARMTTLEGVDNYTSYVTSPTSHWTVSIGIPTSVVTRGIYRAAWVLLLGVIATTALGATIAALLGRRIAGPIAQLASSAPLLGTPGAAQGTRTDIAEVAELAAALERASTEIREREEIASRQRKTIEAADRAKDEFIAMLSHELRNPLAALSNAATVLRLSKPDTEAALNALAIVERQAKQMARLLDDLLDVSQIVAGKATLRIEPLELSELVSRVVQTWRDAGRLSTHDVSLVTDAVWVRADRARVEQIVSNLLDNAVKFTPAGKRISVAVQRAETQGRIVVSDQGTGIAPSDMEHIFELFAQGAQDLSRRRGGIGVGLAIVKRLVEMQGGKVFAVSAGADQGAVFTVEFPACESKGDIHTPAPRGDSGSVIKLVRVLVVEDKEDTRAALVSLLSLQGHIVRQASGGKEALTEIVEHPSDIALIDIGLSDIDGYELARRIRGLSLRRRVYLVAVTGYGQPRDVQHSLEAGFDFHLTKPVAAEDIESLFRRIAPAVSADSDDVSAERPAA